MPTAEQKSRLQDLLEQKAKALTEDLKQTSQNSKPVSLEESIGRLARMDAIQHQQMAMNAKRRVEAQLSAVQVALKRLHLEDFGVCVECEEDIPIERLERRPETVLCLACQRARE